MCKNLDADHFAYHLYETIVLCLIEIREYAVQFTVDQKTQPVTY